MDSVGSPALWAAFLVFVAAMLALDLGVFHRKAHTIGFREALAWSIAWVVMAFTFNGLVWWAFGPERGMEFAAGYLLEKALAVDNLFVFVVIFTAFGVKTEWQHRVLYWGILGALFLRGLFIGLGAALVHRFEWVLYVFGVILVVTAIRLLIQKDEEPDPKNSRIIRWTRKLVPMTDSWRGSALVVRENGRRVATPLLAVLILVEITDLIFAVDSIPAVFAVTQDPFIVFTSNIFAILGLRAMYFLLADVVHRFHYLKPALSLVLAFVGLKLLLHGWIDLPTVISLAVVAGTLTVAIFLSFLFPKVEGEEESREAS